MRTDNTRMELNLELYRKLFLIRTCEEEIVEAVCGTGPTEPAAVATSAIEFTATNISINVA